MTANRPALDTDYIRSQFPCFADPVWGGWAYLENAGGSQTPRQVQEAMAQAFNIVKVQPYYPYGPSAHLGEVLEAARTFMADAMNAGADTTVTFGPATTANSYMIAQGLTPHFGPGDEIVVSNQEHEANAGAWYRLADRTGATVREWHADAETGRLNLEDLTLLLSERTKLLAFTHCSNVIGEIHDAAAIAEMGHDVGARVVVDGVAFAPHQMPDVSAIGADAYMFSTYKTFAAHQGVLAIKTDWLEEIENQGHYFNGIYAEKRINPVGPQHAEIASLTGLQDFLSDAYRHHFGHNPGGRTAEWVNDIYGTFHAHEIAIMAPLLAFLDDHPKVRLLGPASPEYGKRAPTISFTVPGCNPREITAAMAEAKVGAAAGHFYAHRLMPAVGIDPDEGVARISLVAYNTAEEVTRAINAIDGAL